MYVFWVRVELIFANKFCLHFWDDVAKNNYERLNNFIEVYIINYWAICSCFCYITPEISLWISHGSWKCISSQWSDGERVCQRYRDTLYTGSVDLQSHTYRYSQKYKLTLLSTRNIHHTNLWPMDDDSVPWHYKTPSHPQSQTERQTQTQTHRHRQTNESCWKECVFYWWTV